MREKQVYLIRIVSIILTIAVLFFLIFSSIYFTSIYSSPDISIKSSEIEKNSLDDKKEFVEQREKGFLNNIAGFFKRFFGAEDRIGEEILLAPPACGTSITTNLNLDGSMNCAGTALIIGANNVVIDCVNKAVNTITYGTAGGTSRGIEVINHNNSIIRNCNIIKGGTAGQVGSTGIYFWNQGGSSKSITIENTNIRFSEYNLMVRRGAAFDTIATVRNSDFENNFLKVKVGADSAGSIAVTRLISINSIPDNVDLAPICASGNCTVQLFVFRNFQVRVQNNGAPASNIQGATVDIKNKNMAILHDDLISDINGLTPVREILQKIDSKIVSGGSVITDNLNPHFIDAMKTDYASSIDNLVNVNVNDQIFNVVLNGIPPVLTFVEPPTPSNGATLTSSSFTTSTDITETLLDRATSNWNGVGQNVFDSSTRLLMNFDNVAALGETATLIKDMSGNGNDGTVSGAAFTSSGRYNGAFEFESAPADDDRIDLGTPAQLNFGANADKSYTITAWIYPRSYGEGASGNFGKIVDKSSSGSTTGDGGYTFYIRDNENDLGAGHGAGVNSPTNNIINLGVWQHVAISYTDAASDSITFYVNGVNYGTVAVTDGGPDNIGNPVYIGNKNGLTRDFDGFIDEVMMWNRSLTTNEIKQLYYSNLRKYDIDKFRLDVNRGQLLNGVYTFQTFADDKAGNLCSGNPCSTELRTATINKPLPVLSFLDSTTSPIGQTPLNGASVGSSININTDITVPDLNRIAFNWNGVGQNVFDSSTRLLMNFDNVAALGETATLIKDMSGNGNDGTVSGAAFTSSGRYNGAFDFDGLAVNDDNINLGSPRALNFGANADKSYTITAWIYPRTLGEGGFGRIVDRSNSGSNGGGGYTFYTTGNVLTVNHAGSGAISSSIISPDLLNKWSFVSAVYNEDLDIISFYVNGNIVGAPVSQSNVPGNIAVNPVLIGNRNGLDRTFDGFIDEVMMWNRSLTNTEIQQLYISSLRKYDIDKFRLDVIKSGLTAGSYAFQTFADDKAGNLCSGNPCSTELRTVNVDLTPPVLTFVEPPTPLNSATITSFPLVISTNILEPSLGRITFNWNGVGQNLFDSSIRLLMNFDNVAALGETATLIKDMSGNGFDGTVTGATATLNGRYNGAYTFDGGDYITINDGDALDFETAGEHFSAFAWIRPTATLDGDVILQKMDTLTDGWRLILMTSGVVRASINNIDTTSTALVNNGQWHHVGFVANRNGNLQIYIDGVPSGTANSIIGQSMNIGAQILRVGASSYPTITTFFRGDMDEVMIWSKALTAGEIQQLYYSNLHKYDANNWRLNVDRGILGDGVYTFQTFGEDKAGSLGNTEMRTITVDIPFQILSISEIPVQRILENGLRNVVFDATVQSGSLASISNVRADFIPPVGNTRSTPSCSFISNLNIITALYRCTIGIQYYDAPGLWTVNAYATDPSETVSKSSSFVLMSTRAISHLSLASFGSLLPGEQNKYASMQLDNIGNDPINNQQIVVKPFDLWKDNIDSTNKILSSLMTANVNNPATCLGDGLNDNVNKIITGALINIYDGTGTGRSEGNGRETIYYCLSTVPFGLSAGNYQATSGRSWQLTFPDFDPGIPASADKFYVRNSLDAPVAYFGSNGDVVLKGSCTISATCTAPANNAFVLQDSGGNTVAYIDENGNMCIENAGAGGSCTNYDNSASCNPTIDAFVVQVGNTKLSYIDFAGRLCAVGGLYENQNTL